MKGSLQKDHPGADRSVRVWDPVVRAGHWGLALSVAVAMATEGAPALVHDNAGWVALGIVLVRVAWGFAGPPHARFRSFVKGPRRTLAYARDLLRGREAHHLGHNPLGGWMILALLGLVAATAFTGWLSTTDRFWGVDWVQRLHAAQADLLLICILLHLGGVVLTSLRQRENLVRAMITGRKPVPPPAARPAAGGEGTPLRRAPRREGTARPAGGPAPRVP